MVGSYNIRNLLKCECLWKSIAVLTAGPEQAWQQERDLPDGWKSTGTRTWDQNPGPESGTRIRDPNPVPNPGPESGTRIRGPNLAHGSVGEPISWSTE